MIMNVILDKTIESRKLLKPEMRKPFQTTGFIYKALDAAEKQVEEQFEEIERLRRENLRLSKLVNKNGRK